MQMMSRERVRGSGGRSLECGRHLEELRLIGLHHVTAQRLHRRAKADLLAIDRENHFVASFRRDLAHMVIGQAVRQRQRVPTENDLFLIVG